MKNLIIFIFLIFLLFILINEEFKLIHANNIIKSSKLEISENEIKSSKILKNHLNFQNETNIRFSNNHLKIFENIKKYSNDINNVKTSNLIFKAGAVSYQGYFSYGFGSISGITYDSHADVIYVTDYMYESLQTVSSKIIFSILIFFNFFKTPTKKKHHFYF